MTGVRKDRERYLHKLANGSLGLSPEDLKKRNEGLIKEWDDFDTNGHKGLDGQYHQVDNFWGIEL